MKERNGANERVVISREKACLTPSLPSLKETP